MAQANKLMIQFSLPMFSVAHIVLLVETLKSTTGNCRYYATVLLVSVIQWLIILSI